MSTPKEKNKVAPKGQAQASEPAAAAVPGAAGNVDQIRDILFGTQMKDYEERFLRLEENLIQEAADLRSNMNTRLDKLEAHFTKVTEKLDGQIRQEKSDRTDAVKEVNRELKANTNSLQETMEAQNQDLRALIKETRETLESELDRQVTNLLDIKTDRSALAEALRVMAAGIADEKPASKKS